MKIDKIAENIFNDLNSLDVEEVWDNSGNTSCGYTEPYELASEIFEEWSKINKDSKKEKGMSIYVKKNFPEWYKSISKNE